jgi:hypothetical protein
MALVDLFDLLHARKVLAAFGRAYCRLPEKFSETSKDQNSFLDHAVAGLAHDGKVISVRLALFAEMVKGKPWTPGTLKEVGGTEGVGVTFLEETFTASTAPPQHRLHQKAAQAVLKALLPEAGTDIKCHMRSTHFLLEVLSRGGVPGNQLILGSSFLFGLVSHESNSVGFVRWLGGSLWCDQAAANMGSPRSTLGIRLSRSETCCFSPLFRHFGPISGVDNSIVSVLRGEPKYVYQFLTATLAPRCPLRVAAGC